MSKRLWLGLFAAMLLTATLAKAEEGFRGGVDPVIKEFVVATATEQEDSKPIHRIKEENLPEAQIIADEIEKVIPGYVVREYALRSKKFGRKDGKQLVLFGSFTDDAAARKLSVRWDSSCMSGNSVFYSQDELVDVDKEGLQKLLFRLTRHNHRKDDKFASTTRAKDYLFQKRRLEVKLDEVNTLVSRID